MNDPIIRPATSGDVRDIVDWMLRIPLWQRYALSPGRTQHQLQTAIAKGDLVLTADVESPSQGLAWCQQSGMFGAFPYLKLLGVAPEIHGRGVGTHLLNDLESRLFRIGTSCLFLLVSDFNVKGQQFYEARGYRRIGEVPDLVIADVAEFIYFKNFPGLA